MGLIRPSRYHSGVPKLRPFRALRFDTSTTDLSAVLAPPYDIISPAQRRELLARDPHNVVRIELPADLGHAGPEDYAAAAGTAAAWRASGVLVRDQRPTVTVHQMRWRDGEGSEQLATGLFCRLGLEEFGPASGVLPHEKTHGGPKADRYALLKATQLNTSPLVFLAGSDPGPTSAALLELARGEPDATATTPDDVEHRLWIHDGQSAAAVLELMSTAPVTIADGHHRYETALAYRAEQAAEAEGGPDPAWDYLLALIYPLDASPPALPTHRVVRGRPCGDELVERLKAYAEVEPLPHAEALLERMTRPVPLAPDASGAGILGLLTRDRAAMLHLDRAAIGGLLDAGLSEASRGLDVNALSAIVGRVYGDDDAAMAADGRLWYEKDAVEAVRQVAREQASATYLLYGMPPAAISRVAQAGEVMPQKSTYFHPKAPTGLVLCPLD